MPAKYASFREGRIWILASPRARLRLSGACRPSNCCRLLFIGRDWRQKRGDIALEVSKRLNEDGLPSTLTVVGARPTSLLLPPFAPSSERCANRLPRNRPNSSDS